MDLQQRTKRFGIWVMLCAVLLRLTAAGVPEKVVHWLTQPDRVPLLIYLETGRDVRFSASEEVFSDFFRESPPPAMPEGEVPEEDRPAFSTAEAEAVEMYYDCDLRPDLGRLLEKPLVWDLEGDTPKVLIFHTHTTESYTKQTESYEESGNYRTLDETYNMLSIGDRVADLLEEAGIGVVHDRQFHDYPSYNGSYVSARKGLTELLEQYPSIELVLDLHRDASSSGGKQLRTQTRVEGKPSAQLMLVVGTNAAGQDHENWEENLALALKLHLQLQRQDPGIMRPLQLRRQRFNQDVSPGALIVEVGAAGNSHGEALIAAERLAVAITALARGTQVPEK